MDLAGALDVLRHDPLLKHSIKAWHHFPSMDAEFTDFPDGVHSDLKNAFTANGITSLYSHQAAVFEQVLAGKNVVIVTPTASGKTVSFNLPVINHFLKKGGGKSFFIYPTKALAHDQMDGLRKFMKLINNQFHVDFYDGDTPQKDRERIRQTADIVVTNPDMLHASILPDHERWKNFLGNLHFVIFDELHMYHGIFGAHVANVVRRLKRLSLHYGGAVRFICASATIANPCELAALITGEPAALVDKSGAPKGDRHFLYYNPPFLSKKKKTRVSHLVEAERFASFFMHHGIKTILFVGSRQETDLVLARIRRRLGDGAGNIMAYRGGYTPSERRALEIQLADEKTRGIISTNALEIGIDVGSIDVVIIAGYPGTIAAVHQQAGRAGRQLKPSCSIFIAAPGARDQFLIENDAYLFEQPSERLFLDPFQPSVFIRHLHRMNAEYALTPAEMTEAKLKLGASFHLDADSVEAKGRFSIRGDRDAEYRFVTRARDTPHAERFIASVSRRDVVLKYFPGMIYLHEDKWYSILHVDHEHKKVVISETDKEVFTRVRLSGKLDVQTSLTCRSRGRYRIEKITCCHTESVDQYGYYRSKDRRLIEKKTPDAGTLTYEKEHSANCLQISEKRNNKKDAIYQAAAHVFEKFLPLMLCVSENDLSVKFRQTSEGYTFYFLDPYGAGIGITDKIFNEFPDYIHSIKNHVKNCACKTGCLNCGILSDPHEWSDLSLKKGVLKILDKIECL